MAQAPGWYPSPTHPGMQQWFDGTEWSPRFQPGPGQASPSNTGKIVLIVVGCIVAAIVLAGILGAVLFAASGDTKDRAGIAVCKTELATLETAIAAWQTDTANVGFPTIGDLTGTSGYLRNPPKFYDIQGETIVLTADGDSEGCQLIY